MTREDPFIGVDPAAAVPDPHVGGRDVPAGGGPRVETSSPSTRPKRGLGKPAGLLLVLAGAVLVTFVLVSGGTSPSAVGPVVFRGNVTVSGRVRLTESFMDSTTATKVSSCSSAAAHGDRPAVGANTWLVPTPPGNNVVEVEIGTSKGTYHGPGHYPQEALLQGSGAMEIGQESYDLTNADATASMTIDSDGSGVVTFTHVPGDDDRPYRGWRGGITGTITWTCSS